MYLLGVKKVQICPFKGTAPATSCCTPKGKILNPYFSVYTYPHVVPNLYDLRSSLEHKSKKLRKKVNKDIIKIVNVTSAVQP